MPNWFKQPLLAAKIESESDYAKIRYPLLASPKLDGIRAYSHPDLGLVSRTLKQIPNQFIQRELETIKCLGFDGELFVGGETEEGVFNRTQSAVMSSGGESAFHYTIFDRVDAMNLNMPFTTRLQMAQELANSFQHPRINVLHHELIENRDQLEVYETEMLERGYEGVMLRDPRGRYKCNRSTLREGILIKLKRFADAEAKIVGWEPLMRNENEAFKDARGYTRRTTHQSGKVADETLIGKFLAEGINGRFMGIRFAVGSGLDDAERLRLRKLVGEDGDPGQLRDRIFTYKFQAYGSKDAPRAPIWKGLRPELDGK